MVGSFANHRFQISSVVSNSYVVDNDGQSLFLYLTSCRNMKQKLMILL
jgi:hypothetical protein